MKLLNQSTSTQIITTNDYEIPGVNPDHVILRETVTEIGDDVTVHKELHKTLTDKKYSKYTPEFVLPEFFDYIQKNHPFGDYNELENYIVDHGDLVDNATIVWFCSYDHTLLDQNLDPLPFALTYDYIGTFFSNEYINFNDDFLNFLRNHPWVVNKNDIKVKDIPYYNATDGKDRYVEVTLYPDKETYKEIFAYSKIEDLDVEELISGSPCIPDDSPDWFGIKPWLND